jgi:subtilisin family serine protease
MTDSSRRIFTVLTVLFAAGSAHAENLILTGKRADLARFRSTATDRIVSQPLFTASEQAFLVRLGKTDMAATLLVRGDESAAEVALKAKHLRLHVERDRKVKVKSLGRDPLSDELWGISNNGDSRKFYIDNFTSIVVKGIVGEDVHLPRYSNEGKGMVVAVLDSGFDTSHPDLSGQFVTKPAECENLKKYLACVAEAEKEYHPSATCDATFMKLDTDGNGYPMDCHGWNFVGKKNKISQQYGSPDIAEQFEKGSGHGTKVAGVIAALADNGIGVRGIAPGVKLLGVRVISEEPGAEIGGIARPDQAVSLLSTVVRGMLYAISENANIVNLSLGWNGRADSPLMREAVKTAQEKGIIVVAAAGNDSTDALVYPCQYEGVVCVGSHDPDGKISEFSNFGSGVDIAAPGFSILSTIDREADPIYFTDRQNYDFDSGTSFASPYVAGAVAILRSQGYSVSETIARLLVGARPKAYSEGKVVLTGNLDVSRAMAATPRPFFTPENKGIYPVLWDRTKNTADLGIDLKNIWKTAKTVRIHLSLSARDRALGQLRIVQPDFVRKDWKSGEVHSLETALKVLDPKATSDATLVLELSADGGPTQKIRVPIQMSVVLRKDTKLPNAITIPVRGTVDPDGVLFSVQSVDGRPEQDYVAIELGDETWKYQIIREVLENGADYYVAGPIKSIPAVPHASPRTSQRLDVNLDGKPDYVFSIYVPSEEKDHLPYFRFDYRDENGDEILPSYLFKNRTTVMQLDRFQWIRSGNRLVQIWSGVGTTPKAEQKKFDPWNPNAYVNEETDARLYYHDPDTEDGVRSLPIPADAGLPKDMAYLSLLNQSRSDQAAGKVTVVASETGDYVARVFALEFASTDAAPKSFPIESSRYRNLRSVENVKAYPLDPNPNAMASAFASTSGVQSQRVSEIVKAGDRYLLLDLPITPESALDTAYKTMAAFSEGPTAAPTGPAAFVQASYDVLYRDSTTTKNLSTSLRRYTFLASSLFERTFIPAVAESDGQRLAALQIPDGFGAYPGAEIIVPLRRNGVSVDLIRPAALRIQADPDVCDWLARTDATEANPSQAVYFCGNQFVRLPYRF